MEISPHDRVMMGRALRLAERGRGLVEPNPMVGAVISERGRVLGAGYHRRVGEAHAEVDAIADCLARGHDPGGKTMHVTLEPCCHHGRTPPCVDAVIGAGLARVVVAMQDPDPRVAGRGIARLIEAGVAMHVGVGEGEARRLNEAFLKRMTTGLPWVIVKWAQTLDGRIATATGDSKWISGPESRRQVHELRARVDAIVTGMGTVIADDPALTARDVDVKRVARRVVVGKQADVPAQAKLLNDGGPPVFFHEDDTDLAGMLRWLVNTCDATNVLVEAGGGLVGKLFAQGLVDQALVFIAPKLLGDEAGKGPVRGMQRQTIAEASRLRLVETRRIGGDVVLDYRVG